MSASNPKKVVVPDDSQRDFSRMQGSFVIDLKALFEMELEEVADVIKRASDEEWTVDKLLAEIERIVSW